MAKINARQLFIVGVGRSGTSLLQSMLHSHEQICFTPEINFIRRFLATKVLEELWSRGPAHVIDCLQSDTVLDRLDFSDKYIREILEEVKHSFSARGLYVRLQCRYASEHNKKNVLWFGDKDPRSIEYLPLLDRSFPGMRVLHIIRDPRDVLASKKKAQWSKDRNALTHVFANRVQMRMGRHNGRRMLGSRYMEIIYEELIANPQAVLSQVCSFLDIEFDPTMLDFSESSTQLVSDSEIQWKKETLGPLLSNNSGKWRTELTTWEALFTERACKESIGVGGYASISNNKQLGVMKRVGLEAMVFLVRAIEPLYCLNRNVRNGK